MKVIKMISFYVVIDHGETYEYFDGPLTYDKAVYVVDYEFRAKGIKNLKIATTSSPNMLLVNGDE